MMPPKMVPRALVSLGISTTRMAGWRGPAVRPDGSLMRSRSFLPAPDRGAGGGHGILRAFEARDRLRNEPRQRPIEPCRTADRRGAGAPGGGPPSGSALGPVRPLRAGPPRRGQADPGEPGRRRGGPPGGLPPRLEPRRALRRGTLVGLHLADPDRPQPGDRPPPLPQGRRAHPRDVGAGKSGRACIPRRGGKRIPSGETGAGAGGDGEAPRRAAAGPRNGVLRRVEPERDRGQGRPPPGHRQDEDPAGDEETAERAARRDPGAPVNGEAPTMEDLTILAALEGWIDAPPGAPRQDETTEMLSRLYIEVLGLIPYELAPVSPSAGAKARLMAAVRGETLPAAAEPAPPPQPAMPRIPPP